MDLKRAFRCGSVSLNVASKSDEPLFAVSSPDRLLLRTVSGESCLSCSCQSLRLNLGAAYCPAERGQKAFALANALRQARSARTLRVGFSIVRTSPSGRIETLVDDSLSRWDGRASQSGQELPVPVTFHLRVHVARLC